MLLSFQSYPLGKRMDQLADYNRKALRFINFQVTMNFLLIRNHLSIEDKEIEEVIEQIKQQVGDEAYEDLEKELNDIIHPKGHST
jgi:FKBP-type peptidyl-prolyl cis-trans isomerase (trigger factor)